MNSGRTAPSEEPRHRNPDADYWEAVVMEDIQERYRDLKTRIGNLWEYL